MDSGPDLVGLRLGLESHTVGLGLDSRPGGLGLGPDSASFNYKKVA